MKHFPFFTALFFIILSMPAINTLAGQTPPDTAELLIHITGFENSNGVAKVALVNSKENYDAKKIYKGVDFDIVNNEVFQTIQLPYGEYAVKVFHDENKNNELDTLVFGIPAERYGFSNDARAPFGPPEYDAAVFKLDTAKKEITITVK